MTLTARILRWVAWLIAGAVAVGLLVHVVFSGPATTTYTAYFPRTTGLYSGDEVRILGVKVGTVSTISAGPKQVKVTFEVDSSQKLPAGVKAAIVTQSLVSGRFIQLAPAYTGGAVQAADQAIPLSRTAVPVEFDQLKVQLTRLATALAPTATDPAGAVGGVLTAADANLHGNAAQLNAMLQNLADAASTIAANRGDLFGTVRSLQGFVSALNASDASVRSFSAQLSHASNLLADDRSSLGTALSALQSAVTDVNTFLKENRSALRGGIGAATELSKTLAAKNYQIAELLHVAPTALDNFYNIIDPRYNSAVGTITLTNFNNLSELVCHLVLSQGGTVDTCMQVLTPVLSALHLNSLSLQLSQELNNLFGGTGGSGTATAPAPAAGTSPKPGGGSTSAAPVTGAGGSIVDDPTKAGGLLNLLLPGGGL